MNRSICLPRRVFVGTAFPSLWPAMFGTSHLHLRRRSRLSGLTIKDSGAFTFYPCCALFFFFFFILTSSLISSGSERSVSVSVDAVRNPVCGLNLRPRIKNDIIIWKCTSTWGHPVMFCRINEGVGARAQPCYCWLVIPPFAVLTKTRTWHEQMQLKKTAK